MTHLTTRPARSALALCAWLALTAGALFLYWPAGVAIGAIGGTLATVLMGIRMQRLAALDTVVALPDSAPRAAREPVVVTRYGGDVAASDTDELLIA